MRRILLSTLKIKGRFVHRVICSVAIAVVSLSLSGCAIDRLLNSSEPPEGTEIDPSAVQTRDGALKVQRTAMVGLTRAFADIAYTTSVFTDELAAAALGSGGPNQLDARQATTEVLPGVLADALYSNLHVARINASHAITLLQRFGSSRDSALIAETYAVQAQAIVYLAEAFCSGIPLTRVPLDGDMHYTRGLSTHELLDSAVALFDSAIAYANDSVRVSSLAKLGKGRALVNMGKYTDARDAVQDVETAYQYLLRFSTVTTGISFWKSSDHQNQITVEIVNGEGGTGMDWIASDPALQDPRVPVTAASPHKQLKFSGPSLSVPMTKGVEARMIEAEALLQPANAPSGDWLMPLNSARATVGLPPLSDPGTAQARVDLLFRERAFWFYHEGHRLADYRRLVRQYGRAPLMVYPNGSYTRSTWYIPAYETNYLFSPPRSEEERNHRYSGCINLEP